MRYDVAIDHDELMEARRGTPRRPQAVPQWAQRLAAERWLAGHAVGDLLLALQKANFGPSDQTIRYRWDDNAHVFTGWIESASTFERRQRDTEERDGILAAIREVTAAGDYVPAATQGRRTAHHVLAATEALPETLRSKSATRRFWRHVEHLRRNRILREGNIRRANRHHVATLELKPAHGGALDGASNAPNEFTAPPNISTHGAPAPNASNSAGGYRGRAHAHRCPRCDGEGCSYCADGGGE